MQRLTRALAGRWTIQQTFEPAPGSRAGRVGHGTEVWRPGPGGYSLLEDFHAGDGRREVTGLGVIWWDSQARGLRVVWCASRRADGCLIMSELARWEEGEFVITSEYERDGRKVAYREVFADLTATSFTQRVFEGEPGGKLQLLLTNYATRVGAAKSADRRPAGATPGKGPGAA